MALSNANILFRTYEPYCIYLASSVLFVNCKWVAALSGYAVAKPPPCGTDALGFTLMCLLTAAQTLKHEGNTGIFWKTRSFSAESILKNRSQDPVTGKEHYMC